MVYKLKYIAIPISFLISAKAIDRYYLKNDLRFLFYEIVQPTYRRYDDQLAPDYRDFEDEFIVKTQGKKVIK